MSAGQDFAAIRSSSAVEFISAVPPQPFNPTATSRLEGRPVVRSPEQLRRSFLIDCISVGVDRMQRIFEPMQKQVETWQRSELTDVTANVVIYEARNSPGFAVALNCGMDQLFECGREYIRKTPDRVARAAGDPVYTSYILTSWKRAAWRRSTMSCENLFRSS